MKYPIIYISENNNQIKEIIENEIKIKNNGLPKNYDDFNQIKSIG